MALGTTTDIVPFLAYFTAFNFRALAHFTLRERALAA
jgi:hypothetical protein